MLERVSIPDEIPENRAEIEPAEPETEPEKPPEKAEIDTHPACKWCAGRNNSVRRRLPYGARLRFCNLCKREFHTFERA